MNKLSFLVSPTVFLLSIVMASASSHADILIETINMTDSGWHNAASGTWNAQDTDSAFRVGQTSGLFPEFRNFFTFDISGHREIISAELHIAAQVASTGLADAAVETLNIAYYSDGAGTLGDPSIAMMQDAGAFGNQQVFDKMASAPLAGDLAMTGELSGTETLVITLDQNGIVGLLNSHRSASSTLALTGTLDGFGNLFAAAGTPASSDVFLELTTTPEPSSFALLALGGLGFGVFFRRRRNKTMQAV